MRISDWSSDVCSSDLLREAAAGVSRCGDQHPAPADPGDPEAAVRLTAETAATPISAAAFAARLDPLVDPGGGPVAVAVSGGADSTALLHLADVWARERTRPLLRSEEHTSELQSLMRTPYAVFCLKQNKHLKTYHL